MRLKRCVFNFFLKVRRLQFLADKPRSSSGSSFHTVGQATANAGGPNVEVRQTGTTTFPEAAEQRWERSEIMETGKHKFVRYVAKHHQHINLAQLQNKNCLL